MKGAKQNERINTNRIVLFIPCIRCWSVLFGMDTKHKGDRRMIDNNSVLVIYGFIILMIALFYFSRIHIDFEGHSGEIVFENGKLKHIIFNKEIEE